MIFGDYQPPVREDGFVSIYQFAQQHHVQKLGCAALEDESWDHLLFEELMSSQQVNEEERPAQPFSSPWAEMLEQERKARRNQESTSWLHSVSADTDFIPPAGQRPTVQTGILVAVDSMEFEVKERIGQGGFASVFRCCKNVQAAFEVDHMAMKVRWTLVAGWWDVPAQNGSLRAVANTPKTLM